MTASGHTHPAHPNAGPSPWPHSGPGPLSSYAPPSLNSHDTNWPSHAIPTRPRHPRRSDSFDSPTVASSSSPSISASTYTTPLRPHPHPYAFTPSLSNATLPPSSPDQTTSSSPYTSPGDFGIPGSKSLVSGRSRSRRRRVSFRIDDDLLHDHEGERHSLPPPRFEDHDDDIEELTSPSKHARAASSNLGRSASVRRESSFAPASKGKAKEIPTVPSRDESESEQEESPSRQAHSGGKVGRRFERGQTPGPPTIITPAARSRSILKHKRS
jgi:hypothetical protein